MNNKHSKVQDSSMITAAVIFLKLVGWVMYKLINFLQKRNDLWCMTPWHLSGDKNIVSLKAAYCAAFLIYDIKFLSKHDDKNLISLPIDDKNIVSFPTVDQ